MLTQLTQVKFLSQSRNAKRLLWAKDRMRARLTTPKKWISSLALLSLFSSPVHGVENELRDSELMKQVSQMAIAGLLDYEKDIAPIIDKHCTSCHNPDDDEGNLDLEALLTTKEANQYPDLWEIVGKTAHMDVMPPLKRKKRPSLRERALIVGWGQQIGYMWDQGIMGYDPGRTTLRRLNRNEYNYTIRDLFGLQIRPADNFPEDSAGEGGFDNDADALFLPALLMENYLEASLKIANTILGNSTRRNAFFLGSSSDLAGARKTLSYWAPLVYRGEVKKQEVDRLVKAYQAARKEGKNHVLAMRDPLVMMLISPRFLYRLELPVANAGDRVALTDFELASRLSYFLWSSMPDPELFNLAKKDELSEPEVLKQQVLRMLKDDKSRSLSMHLGGQWLGWEKLRGSANPDEKKFPIFDFKLRVAMYQESTNFFHHLLREDASIYELLDSKYTFLNDRLAQFYGIKGVSGSEFRKVELDNPHRGGVLGHGSVLVASSMPLRTSPSLRGAYILESILGDKPPSPPMDVEQLPANDTELKTTTIRETLEHHRKSPDCRACHTLIDPLGFGLENFDAIGRWRTEQNGGKIDSSGETPEGETFSNPSELKKLLLTRKEQFTRQAAHKFLSYALGRELTPYDRPITHKIKKEVMEQNGSMQALVLGIVTSEPFLNRQNPKK